MNPYYKLYVYFLGPKILTEIETLQAKLKKGAGDLGCALWVGRDRHPVRQLSTGHPSFRREPWKMINFSKGGLGVKWRKELSSQVLSGKVKVVILCSFSSFVNIHFGFSARWG